MATMLHGLDSRSHHLTTRVIQKFYGMEMAFGYLTVAIRINAAPLADQTWMQHHWYISTSHAFHQVDMLHALSYGKRRRMVISKINYNEGVAYHSWDLDK